MTEPLPPDEAAPSSPDELAAGPSADRVAPLEAPPPVVEAPAEERPKPNYAFLAVVSIVSLAADLGTKTWAEKKLQLGETPAPKTIIKGVFGFMLAKNRGGAWGLLQGASEMVRKPFFVTVSILAIVFIVSLFRRLHPRQKALKWGLPLVLGGALGNLVDRIRYGYVIDFIDWQATWKGQAHHWPTFNVADIAICVGVALMAIDMLSARRTRERASAAYLSPDAVPHAPPAEEPPSPPAN